MATVIAGLDRRRNDMVREAKALFAIGFCYFLIAALVLRLIPKSWRADMMPTNHSKSVIGEAVEGAHTFVGFAFMR